MKKNTVLCVLMLLALFLLGMGSDVLVIHMELKTESLSAYINKISEIILTIVGTELVKFYLEGAHKRTIS